MVDFSIPNERDRWLEAQPDDVVAVLAARAALRVMPTISFASGRGRSRLTRRMKILRVFRAVAAAWSAAAYPGNSDAFHEAARAATVGMSSLELPAAVRAAVYATATAAAPETDARTFASRTVGYTLDAVASDDAAFDITLRAIEADAEFLEQGFSSVTLANSQLWPGRLPDWVMEKWDDLKTELLAALDNWNVWTIWYDDRLRGTPGHHDIEFARVTIPNELWEQDPKFLNSRIKEIFEEHGISSYTTRDEPEREPPTAASETSNEYDLERRLAALSSEELRVVSARVALRAIPLLGLTRRNADSPEFAFACLSAFGGAAKAWYAARFPTRRDILDQFDRASRIFPAGGYEDDLGMMTAGAVVSATDLSATPWTVASCVGSIQAIVDRASPYMSDKTFDAAVSDDIRDLDGASTPAIAGLPLWPGGSPPPWITNRWERLKRDLIKVGVGWEAWVNWYDYRLRGDVRSEAHELAYVEVPDEFWADSPARVNTWILGKIQAESPPQVAPADEADVAGAAAFTQRPAAFHFMLRGERIEAVPQQDPSPATGVARDIYAELKIKVTDLADRLQKSNAVPRLRQTVQRLLDCLGMTLENVKPGILLMRYRSLEADALAFDTPDGRKELFSDAIAMMRDVIASVDDLMGAYPSIRKIQAAALALELQRVDVEAVQMHLDDIRNQAAHFELVAPSAQEALSAALPDVEEATGAIESAKDDIARAAAIDLRAELVSLQVLDYRNFISAVVQPLSSIGKGLSEVARKSLKEAKDAIPRAVGSGVEETVKGLIKGGMATLVGSLFGPVAGLAVLIASLRPLSRKVEQIHDAVQADDTDEQPTGSK